MGQAVVACRRAADARNTEAATALGMLFTAGHGVGRSDDSAARWFGRAASANDPTAMYQLGQDAEHGRGTARNPAAAVDRYTRAAKAGDAKSAWTLGQAYEKGHLGLAKDKNRALDWYRQSADRGNADAAARVRALSPP